MLIRNSKRTLLSKDGCILIRLDQSARKKIGRSANNHNNIHHDDDKLHEDPLPLLDYDTQQYE